jgi:CBS domain containing-hemolysin-like protein
MTVLIIIGIVVSAVLLVLVTLVQMCYMENLRLRTREAPFQQSFKESIDERIGMKADTGSLTFSLIKHTVLVLMTVCYFAVAAQSSGVNAPSAVEAALFSWLTMVATTYVVPHLLYRRTSGRWFVPLTPLVTGLALAAKPLTALMTFLQSLLEPGEPEQRLEEAATEEESVEALITAGTEEGIIEEEDRRLIHSVVAFGNKTVREVMTPRPNIVAISADATLDDLRTLVIHEQYSRIPVYEGSIDQIIGFVHVRDMFEVDQTARNRRTVREILRPIRYVPETKPVNDLLKEMQQTGAHMAIVVDEYGNTAGLATMEDMVEEIVGEIRDEHEPTLDIEQDDEGAYIVSGSFDLDHLRELLEFRVQEDTESTTVGGLVTEWLGRVPQPGEAVERDGIRIEVLAGNELRVEQVRISKAEPAHAELDPDA